MRFRRLLSAVLALALGLSGSPIRVRAAELEASGSAEEAPRKVSAADFSSLDAPAGSAAIEPPTDDLAGSDAVPSFAIPADPAAEPSPEAAEADHAAAAGSADRLSPKLVQVLARGKPIAPEALDTHRLQSQRWLETETESWSLSQLKAIAEANRSYDQVLEASKGQQAVLHLARAEFLEEIFQKVHYGFPSQDELTMAYRSTLSPFQGGLWRDLDHFGRYLNLEEEEASAKARGEFVETGGGHHTSRQIFHRRTPGRCGFHAVCNLAYEEYLSGILDAPEFLEFKKLVENENDLTLGNQIRVGSQKLPEPGRGLYTGEQTQILREIGEKAGKVPVIVPNDHLVDFMLETGKPVMISLDAGESAHSLVIGNPFIVRSRGEASVYFETYDSNNPKGERGFISIRQLARAMSEEGIGFLPKDHRYAKLYAVPTFDEQNYGW